MYLIIIYDNAVFNYRSKWKWKPNILGYKWIFPTWSKWRKINDTNDIIYSLCTEDRSIMSRRYQALSMRCNNWDPHVFACPQYNMSCKGKLLAAPRRH